MPEMNLKKLLEEAKLDTVEMTIAAKAAEATKKAVAQVKKAEGVVKTKGKELSDAEE